MGTVRHRVFTSAVKVSEWQSVRFRRSPLPHTPANTGEDLSNLLRSSWEWKISLLLFIFVTGKADFFPSAYQSLFCESYYALFFHVFFSFSARASIFFLSCSDALHTTQISPLPLPAISHHPSHSAGLWGGGHAECPPPPGPSTEQASCGGAFHRSQGLWGT